MNMIRLFSLVVLTYTVVLGCHAQKMAPHYIRHRLGMDTVELETGFKLFTIKKFRKLAPEDLLSCSLVCLASEKDTNQHWPTLRVDSVVFDKKTIYKVIHPIDTKGEYSIPGSEPPPKRNWALRMPLYQLLYASKSSVKAVDFEPPLLYVPKKVLPGRYYIYVSGYATYPVAPYKEEFRIRYSLDITSSTRTNSQETALPNLRNYFLSFIPRPERSYIDSTLLNKLNFKIDAQEIIPTCDAVLAENPNLRHLIALIIRAGIMRMAIYHDSNGKMPINFFDNAQCLMAYLQCQLDLLYQQDPVSAVLIFLEPCPGITPVLLKQWGIESEVENKSFSLAFLKGN